MVGMRFADRDARQIATFLQSKKGGSVPASHIRLLTNAQASRTAIIQAMSLFSKAGPADRVLLYFSGHGLANNFIPYDVQPGQPGSVLTHQTVKAAFRQSKAHTKICIADACLSVDYMRKRSPPSVQGMAGAFTAGNNVAMLLAGRSTQLRWKTSGGLAVCSPIFYCRDWVAWPIVMLIGS